jgi:pilus assembly protein Flp/PilA
MKTKLQLAHIKWMLKKDDGATAIEYALLVALIALVIIAVVTLLGQNLSGIFNNVQTYVKP